MSTSEQTRILSLASLARALGGSEPLFSLLETAAEGARAALHAATVSVSQLVPSTLTVRTVVNVGDLGPGEERWPADETYVIEEFNGISMMRDRLPTWVWDVDDPDCPAPERALLTSLGKGKSLGAPIFVDGRLWGEFYLTRHRVEDGFDDLDRAYTEALLAILSGAISRALREESLEQLAYRDPLTGLLNRRALDEQAQEAFSPSPGRTHRITVVTVDINRLKEVNDTLGHEAGDHLIAAVARDLQAAYNPLTGAVVARVGGDEFTVLVTGADPLRVVAISDELCRKTWRFGRGAGVSAGAATRTVRHGEHVSPTDLFAAADRAQYVAKHGRLSTTVLADDLDPELESSRSQDG